MALNEKHFVSMLVQRWCGFSRVQRVKFKLSLSILFEWKNLNFHLVGCRSAIYSYFDFGLKNSSFWLPYQSPSSSTDCARELFNGLDGSASLVDYTRKKMF